jgi:DNA-binding XRE family transcriptional regulator
MSLTKYNARNDLYALRRNRGFRQKQLAFLLGYRRSAMVSRFETGASFPPLKVAFLMELVLGAKVSEIYVNEYRRMGEILLGD